jgi:hypothetical protein
LLQKCLNNINRTTSTCQRSHFIGILTIDNCASLVHQEFHQVDAADRRVSQDSTMQGCGIVVVRLVHLVFGTCAQQKLDYGLTTTLTRRNAKGNNRDYQQAANWHLVESSIPQREPCSIHKCK